MLRLFFAIADCDWDEGKLKNVRLLVLTTKMKNLLDKLVSVCPTQLSNLFQTIFNEVPDNKIDQLNPLHSRMSITYFDKKFSTDILFARFQDTELDGASYESTDINVFHFAPQNNNAPISAACLCDANAWNESKFKIHESQHSKAKSTIKGIGHVNDIEDVVKLCANLCAIQCAIVDVQGVGFPFLHEFSVKIILCIHNLAFQCWYSKNNSKLLHLQYIFCKNFTMFSHYLQSFPQTPKIPTRLRLGSPPLTSKS